tara:strand:+ start:1313 stop:1924 length:612 start_codon:yes stop_codon:yes gene_type:complete
MNLSSSENSIYSDYFDDDIETVNNIRPDDTEINVNLSQSDTEQSEYEDENEYDESKSPDETRAVTRLEKTASRSVLENSLESSRLEECIICLDKGDKKLVKNFLCDCVFYYHPECYAEWIVSNNYEDSKKCIVCKKPFQINPNLFNKSEITYILSFDRKSLSTYELCCSDLQRNLLINCKNSIAIIAIFLIGTLFFIILTTHS